MVRCMKRKPPEPWQLEDAARLLRLFKSRSTMSQEAFGAQWDIGSQGAVWQYLHGAVPLNLPAALKFARGLNVPLAEISPTLATSLTGVERNANAVLEDLSEQLRYLLHAHFPELSEVDVAEVLGYAKGIAQSKKSHPPSGT